MKKFIGGAVTIFILWYCSTLYSQSIRNPGISSGGTFSSPLIGPAANNCSNPPYTFTGDTTSGICSTAAGTIVFRATGVNLWKTVGSFSGGPTPISSDNVWLGDFDLFWRYLYITRAIQFGSKKTLADGSITPFLNIQPGALNAFSGTLFYSISADNATDEHVRGGSVPFSIVMKGTTITCGFGTVSDSFNRTDASSTLSIAFDTSTTTTDCSLRANADTSFISTSPLMEYMLIVSVDNDTIGVSVLPQ